MRAVTTATAAAVLGIHRKALDSLLVRLGADVLPQGRQGRERRIPVSLLEVLALTGDIAAAMEVPAKQAFAVARVIIDNSSSTRLGPFLTLNADLTALRQDIGARLEIAIETVVRPNRGRPRITPERRRA